MKLLKFFLCIIQVLFVTQINAQVVINNHSDNTFMIDFRDGYEWAYSTKGNFKIGVTNKIIKDSYGKFFQISISMQNTGDLPFTFDPELISSELQKLNGDIIELEVFTNEDFQKKMERTHNWAMVLTSISNGINTGLASSQTTYTTRSIGNYATYTVPTTTYNHSAAYATQVASNIQMNIMKEKMEKDVIMREEGYLKKNTIYPNEVILGYFNIKFVKRGEIMKLNIPINNEIFSFSWDVLPRE